MAALGYLEHRSRRPLDAPAPALMELYAHKPLPPLPLNLRRQRPRCRVSTGAAEPASQPRPGPGNAAEAADVEAAGPRRDGGTGACRTRSRRQSSYKILQLTGYDVDVADDGPADSDCSSVYSLGGDDGGHRPVPRLEADGGDAPSSRGSSWGPLSPRSAPSGSPPLGGSRRPVIRCGSDTSLGSSEAHRWPGGEWTRRWDPAYGQFSDSKAAGEYHRIASEIAAPRTGTRRRRPASSVDVDSARARRAPRRDAWHAAEATGRSAFESDSSDGEARAAGRGGIREWFGRKSDEAPHAYGGKGAHNEAGPRTSRAGEQVRELLHRARLLHTTREERRRQPMTRTAS